MSKLIHQATMPRPFIFPNHISIANKTPRPTPPPRGGRERKGATQASYGGLVVEFCLALVFCSSIFVTMLRFLIARE